jgi:hypothetical protein
MINSENDKIQSAKTVATPQDFSQEELTEMVGKLR